MLDITPHSVYLELAQEKERIIIAEALIIGSYGAALFLAGTTFFYLAEAISNGIIPKTSRGGYITGDLIGVSAHALVGLLILAIFHFILRKTIVPKPLPPSPPSPPSPSPSPSPPSYASYY
jgi:hypothetical protein